MGKFLGKLSQNLKKRKLKNVIIEIIPLIRYTIIFRFRAPHTIVLNYLPLRGHFSTSHTLLNSWYSVLFRNWMKLTLVILDLSFEPQCTVCKIKYNDFHNWKIIAEAMKCTSVDDISATNPKTRQSMAKTYLKLQKQKKEKFQVMLTATDIAPELLVQVRAKWTDSLREEPEIVYNSRLTISAVKYRDLVDLCILEEPSRDIFTHNT